MARYGKLTPNKHYEEKLLQFYRIFTQYVKEKHILSGFPAFLMLLREVSVPNAPKVLEIPNETGLPLIRLLHNHPQVV